MAERRILSKERHAGLLLLEGESRQKVAEKLGLAIKAVERAERKTLLKVLRDLAIRVGVLEHYLGPREVKRFRKSLLRGE